MGDQPDPQVAEDSSCTHHSSQLKYLPISKQIHSIMSCSNYSKFCSEGSLTVLY